MSKLGLAPSLRKLVTCVLMRLTTETSVKTRGSSRTHGNNSGNSGLPLVIMPEHSGLSGCTQVQRASEANREGIIMLNYGDKMNYRKIDLFYNELYICSTTWARTCKEAKAVLAAQLFGKVDPSKIVAHFSK